MFALVVGYFRLSLISAYGGIEIVNAETPDTGMHIFFSWDLYISDKLKVVRSYPLTILLKIILS